MLEIIILIMMMMMMIVIVIIVIINHLHHDTTKQNSRVTFCVVLSLLKIDIIIVWAMLLIIYKLYTLSTTYLAIYYIFYI